MAPPLFFFLKHQDERTCFKPVSIGTECGYVQRVMGFVPFQDKRHPVGRGLLEGREMAPLGAGEAMAAGEVAGKGRVPLPGLAGLR